MKHVEVVAAIIQYQDKLLCVQRGDSKYAYISRKYEFPGGKVEPGESQTEALKREISEELQMNISVDMPFLTVEHKYPDFTITMHSYICSVTSRELKLSEHIDFKWLAKADLGDLDWAAADVPIVQKLVGP